MSDLGETKESSSLITPAAPSMEAIVVEDHTGAGVDAYTGTLAAYSIGFGVTAGRHLTTFAPTNSPCKGVKVAPLSRLTEERVIVRGGIDAGGTGLAGGGD